MVTWFKRRFHTVFPFFLSSFSLSLSLSLSLSFSFLCLCLPLFLSLSVCLSLSVSACLSILSLSVSVLLCLSICLSVSHPEVHIMKVETSLKNASTLWESLYLVKVFVLCNPGYCCLIVIIPHSLVRLRSCPPSASHCRGDNAEIFMD